MSFFNFDSKKTQSRKYEELLEEGISAFNNDDYAQAVEYFNQAAEILEASYDAAPSDADRSALFSVLMFRGRSLFMMEDLQKAHLDFMRLYEQLKDIPVQQDNIKDCRLLRQACEFGAATAEETGDMKMQKEFVEKHLDISRRIFEATEMAEDYMELGDSYDYMINISDSWDEKIANAEKMKDVYKNLTGQAPRNAYFSERLEDAYETVEDLIKEKISEALDQDDFSASAAGYEHLMNVRMEQTMDKKEVRFEDLDKDVELFHEAAENYQKAGDKASAVRCLESAIRIRSAVVKSTGSDSARVSLCYSYVMAITTDPTIARRKEYAQTAYDMLAELEKKCPEDSSVKQLKEIASRFMN